MRATELGLHTSEPSEIIEITKEVEARVVEQGWHEGMLFIQAPHTTAGVLITENADPAVARDMLAQLDRMVPENQAWLREDGKSHAHIKSSLIGPQVAVPVLGGRLQLGRWQGVFLAEFGGPRDRSIRLYFLQA